MINRRWFWLLEICLTNCHVENKRQGPEGAWFRHAQLDINCHCQNHMHICCSTKMSWFIFCTIFPLYSPRCINKHFPSRPNPKTLDIHKQRHNFPHCAPWHVNHRIGTLPNLQDFLWLNEFSRFRLKWLTLFIFYENPPWYSVTC